MLHMPLYSRKTTRAINDDVRPSMKQEVTEEGRCGTKGSRKVTYLFLYQVSPHICWRHCNQQLTLCHNEVSENWEDIHDKEYRNR